MPGIWSILRLQDQGARAVFPGKRAARIPSFGGKSIHGDDRPAVYDFPAFTRRLFFSRAAPGAMRL